MKKFFILINSLLFSLLGLSLAHAQENPMVLVTNTSGQVHASLMKENSSNTAEIRKEVEAVLFPRFDFTRMTALAVGKNWKQATPEQKTALATEFKILLTNTYFNTMLRYRDAKISVKPDVLLENDGKQATVKSAVMVANATDPISIDYVLYNTEDGWKVFNVNVEGASLVTVYRNQFGEEISKSGIDGLIQSLRTKNAANGTPEATAASATGKN
jgi:phospholipid transport system substrate-binding protein